MSLYIIIFIIMINKIFSDEKLYNQLNFNIWNRLYMNYDKNYYLKYIVYDIKKIICDIYDTHNRDIYVK